MTMQELNAHFRLLQELQEMQELHSYLLGKAEPGAQRLTGMPHISGVSDPTGDLGTEIAGVSSAIDEKKAEIKRSEPRIKAFVDSIADYKTRRIFRLRFLSGLLWKQVADLTGKGRSISYVAGICYDYLNNLQNAESEDN